MITISFLSDITGLPLQSRSIQLVFTDTVFGWIRPGLTDEGGVARIQTRPGPARVYVEGEFIGEYWLKEEIEIKVKEMVDTELAVEDKDLVQARSQEQNTIKEQGVPTNILTLESEQEVRA